MFHFELACGVERYTKTDMVCLITGASWLTLTQMIASIFGISRDDKRLNYVKKLAQTLGLQNNIVFKTAMLLSEMLALYRAHDVLSLPSYIEAIGLVVLEAMSFGRPAFTSDTVGANVYVKDGVTGFIFTTGDINSLAEKLRNVVIKII